MHQDIQPLISHQQARINLNAIKLQISKKIGPDRTEAYFGFLTKFLSRKLTKAAFNKFCLLVLGRGNIPLHNNLIRSILKNAYEAKTPPPAGENFVLDQTEASAKTSVHGNEPLNLLQPTTPATPNQCNVDILHPWLRKKRTQKSPLGSNGSVDKAQPADISIKENGVLGPSDLKKPRQHDQSGFAEKPPKYPRRAFSLFRDHICLRRKRQLEAAAMEERKKMKISDLNSIKSSLRAPIGVSYRPSSVGGKMRSLHSALAGNRDTGELYHTEDLKRSMERVAEEQGIGVTLGCADLLNKALNTYLKRIIKSTIELARGRSMHKPTKHPVLKEQVNGRTLNDIWTGNHMNLQNSLESMNVSNGHRNQYMISLQDFQAAMELNPQQLGEDWPLQVEKISLHSFKE